MTLTAAQVRQACVLLRWKSAMLSRCASVSFMSAWSARQDEMIGAVSTSDLEAIRATFEKAGVRFDLDADGQPSAVLQTPP